MSVFIKRLNICLLLLLAGATAAAQTESGAQAEDAAQFEQLESESRDIKAQVLELEAELSALEEDIRTPVNRRWTVFVTAAKDPGTPLSVIELQVAGRTLASHKYSESEQEALSQGGAHRLFLGTLAPGEHSLSVRFGTDNGGNELDSNVEFVIDKQPGAQLLELRWQPDSGNASIAAQSYRDTP